MKHLLFGDESSFALGELFDGEGIEFKSLRVSESLFGTIPEIELVYRGDNEFFKVNDEVKGELKSSTGRSNKFKGFVYGMKYSLNEYTINILCCDRSFTKDRAVTKYTSVDNAINALSRMQRVGSVKSDLLEFQDPYYIYQRNETNYHLCSRLCFSYKRNTVYGFLLDGLRFVDLNSYSPVTTLTDGTDMKLESNPSWADPKLYGEVVEQADYNAEEPVYERDDNHRAISMYEDIVMVDSPYEELIGNYLHNQRLSTSRSVYNFTLKNLPDYQVGDFLKIKSPSINFSECYVTGRTIDCTMSEMKVNVSIQSIK